MALDPIPPLARLPASRSAGQSPDRPPPGVAQTLRLVLGNGAAGELLGHGEHGQTYRLFANGAAPGWREGQTLLVQILRTGPPLEVRVLGTLGDPGAAPDDGIDSADPPALRPDQAAILRLAAATGDSMAQAAHWRQLTLAALRQARAVAPGHAVLAAPAEALGPRPLHDPALLLRQLPWHGHPLLLWLEQRRGHAGPNRRARRRAGMRLCLALTLPPWGTLGLVLDVLDVQVGLSVLTTEAAAVTPLRALAGRVAARLGRCGLRLMRCHVRHAPDFAPPSQSAPTPALAEHELSLSLFRAGAEALEALRRGLAATGRTEGA